MEGNEAKEAPGFEESERPTETESKDRAQEDETAVARGRAGYIARSRTKTWRRPPLFLSRPGPVWTTSIVSRFGRPFKTYDPSRVLFRAGGRLSRKCEAETLPPAESSSIALVKTLHFTMVSIMFLSTEANPCPFDAFWLAKWRNFCAERVDGLAGPRMKGML